MPHAIRPLPRFAFLALLALGAAQSLACGRAGAAEARFVSLVPTGAGEWVGVVEAAGVKGEALAFSADGTAVKAAAEPAEGGRLRVRLSGVPAGARRLEIAAPAKGGKPEPLAAVDLGGAAATSGAGGARPWDGWTIYHVMMEMFADGNKANDGEISGWKHPNYAGGDLQGLLDHAAYLQELGVDAVWLSPIFAARTSHGYDVSNYYRIGEAMGVPGNPQASLDLFRKVVADLHGRGIRVILDLPLNHASGAYQRPEGDPEGLKPRATGPRQPAEKLWDSWGSGYRYWDFDHEPTRHFLKDVALYWLTKESVDGLRLDYVRGVPHDFWAELSAAVAKAKPEAYLVGECWADEQGAEGNAREIASYYAPVGGTPQLPSLLDFPLQMAMIGSFARGASATELEVRLQGDAALYGPAARPTYFFDNHDLARFLAWTSEPKRLVAAVGFLASLSGPVVLFYGTETGLSHGGPKAGFTDAGRIPMPWDHLDAPLGAQVRAILEARRAHPALAHGGRLPLLADKETLVMAKVSPAETALVGVNLSSSPREVALDLGTLGAGAFTPVVGATAPVPGEAGKPARWTLPPLSTSIAIRGTPAP